MSKLQDLNSWLAVQKYRWMRPKTATKEARALGLDGRSVPPGIPCRALLLVIALLLGLGESSRGGAGELPSRTPLTRIDEIRALTEEEADQHLPARITGVVTFYFPSHGMLFLQDGGHGIFIGLNGEAPEIPWLRPGVLVQVDGYTSSGGFMSCLWNTPDHPLTLIPLSQPGLPEPKRVDARALVRDPRLDCDWVQVGGEVYKVNVLADHIDLSVRHAADLFTVTLPLDPSESTPPWNLVGKQITVCGAVVTQANGRRQMTGRVICAPSMRQIKVITPDSEDPFALPVQPLNTVLRIHQPSVNTSAVHVQGTVTYADPNEGLCIQGDSGSIWIHPAQPVADIRPGDILDVVGLPVPRVFKPELESGRFRVIGRGKLVKPKQVGGSALATGMYQTDLVVVEGILVDLPDEDQEARLLLRVGERMVQVIAPRGLSVEAMANMRLQSKIRATGVLRAIGIHAVFSPPTVSEFTLRVPRAADIKLLRSGPPFGLEDLALVLQGVGLVALICAAWVFFLRRRVARLTGMVREQLQTATREEERIRIARELHDSLQQHLVGLGLQLRTGLSHLPQRPEQALKSLEVADHMLRHSLTEAHQSVWDLRTSLGGDEGLVSAIRKILLPLSDRASWFLDLQVTPPDLELSPSVRHDTLRVIQEAVTNASRHANPTKIVIKVLEQSDGVVVEIIDDGKGFDPDSLKREGRISFGMVGMRERAVRIGAKLSVTSSPGRGTCVRVVGLTAARPDKISPPANP